MLNNPSPEHEEYCYQIYRDHLGPLHTRTPGEYLLIKASIVYRKINNWTKGRLFWDEQWPDPDCEYFIAEYLRRNKSDIDLFRAESTKALQKKLFGTLVTIDPDGAGLPLAAIESASKKHSKNVTGHNETGFIQPCIAVYLEAVSRWEDAGLMAPSTIDREIARYAVNCTYRNFGKNMGYDNYSATEIFFGLSDLKSTYLRIDRGAIFERVLLELERRFPSYRKINYELLPPKRLYADSLDA